jgi:hypothetical protein
MAGVADQLFRRATGYELQRAIILAVNVPSRRLCGAIFCLDFSAGRSTILVIPNSSGKDVWCRRRQARLI